MPFARRQFLHLALGGAALPTMARIAGAQAYPARPVRLIVGARADGGFDIAGRLMAQWLSMRLGAPFVIENHPGGAGNIGTEVATRAVADGTTLLVIGPPHTINVTLYDKLNFNFVRDIVPVGGFVRVPQLMAAPASFPPRTVPEFIAYAKANPGSIKMASVGVGSGIHLAGELFKMLSGVDLTHVPYRDTPQALAALAAGQAQVMFDPLPSSIDLVRSGKLRALAVTTAVRSDALPEVPAIDEFVPGYGAGGWTGLGAPAGTPVEIIELINHELNAALADAAMKAKLKELGGAGLGGTRSEFAAFVGGEIEKWGKVVKFSGAKPK